MSRSLTQSHFLEEVAGKACADVRDPTTHASIRPCVFLSITFFYVHTHTHTPARRPPQAQLEMPNMKGRGSWKIDTSMRVPKSRGEVGGRWKGWNGRGATGAGNEPRFSEAVRGLAEMWCWWEGTALSSLQKSVRRDKCRRSCQVTEAKKEKTHTHTHTHNHTLGSDWVEPCSAWEPSADDAAGGRHSHRSPAAKTALNVMWDIVVLVALLGKSVPNCNIDLVSSLFPSLAQGRLIQTRTHWLLTLIFWIVWIYLNCIIRVSWHWRTFYSLTSVHHTAPWAV